jgi:hypothetical protein
MSKLDSFRSLGGGRLIRILVAMHGCCYITVDSTTTALQNSACTYQSISEHMHYKTPFSHNGYTKSLEFYEKYIILFCVEKIQTF